MNMRTSPPRAQTGAALFIALVALLAMTLAGLSLVRAMDSAGLIAGNFSFRQAASSVADLGLEKALVALETTYIPNGRDRDQRCDANQTSNCNSNCSQDCTYWAFYYDPNPSSSVHCQSGSSCDNSNGVSQRINWSNIPENTVSFAPLGSGYRYQYVIERLCDASQSGSIISSSNLNRYCYSMNLQTGGNSQESRSAQLGTPTAANEIAYRITLRITGPRNSSTMVQAILMKN